MVNIACKETVPIVIKTTLEDATSFVSENFVSYKIVMLKHWLDIMLKLAHLRELEFVVYHAENGTFEGIGICWISC